MLVQTDNIVKIQNHIIRKKHRYHIQIKVILLHINITRHKISFKDTK